MKKLIIAAGLLMTTSAYAQTEVLTGVTRGKDYGVVYSLPKTQIELEIKANKVKYTPGEFSKYADRYLRLNNVSTDPEVYWELASVKVKQPKQFCKEEYSDRSCRAGERQSPRLLDRRDSDGKLHR